MENPIKNFVIIAHIDSGKSTLADRLLEITHTVEKREMQPQYLDQLELERERGITIKMAPVRMIFDVRCSNCSKLDTSNTEQAERSNASNNAKYILNLIDTPGHSDFGYEVSRALAAVEGAVLLVDGTKGIQAQTLANLRAARAAGLAVIGAVNKIDMQLPDLPKTVESVARLLGVAPEEIFRVSAKTGEGVAELLEAVIRKTPPPSVRENQLSHPQESATLSRALIFDSLYDDHKGILAYVRMFDGEIRAGDEIRFASGGAAHRVKEVGYFRPKLAASERLAAGEIGYIATGLKEPSLVNIGDTVVKYQVSSIKYRSSDIRKLALPGYREPKPVVFISLYPDGRSKFEDLERGLQKLRLTDAALHFEPDANEALGRGFKVGFLGQLHFEITSSRLEREFGLEFLTTFPTIAYRVTENGQERVITTPQDFPVHPEKVFQPVVGAEIVSPAQYLHAILGLASQFDLEVAEVKNMGEHLIISGRMPLMELIRDFDDRLKSASSGYASFSYEPAGEAPADVRKLEILIVGDEVPALTRIVAEKDVEYEARRTVERLKDLLPREQFAQAIQARVDGRIIARETIPALRKLLGNFGKTGGDRTRKMKLWKKQERGKKRLRETAKVNLSPEVFREILKK